MGSVILTKVQDELEIAGFSVNTAYPGEKFPKIQETVATVHMERLDGNSQEATVEVDIICPASLGGTMCEYQAFTATEALTAVGASCIQNGCVYHAATNTFMVKIHATFAGNTQNEDGTVGPGFQVYINNVMQPYAIGFTSQKEADHKMVYSAGIGLPNGSTVGPLLYSFRLEEMIPLGQAAAAEPSEPFSLRMESETSVEKMFMCRCTKIQREYTKEGLRRIRMGFGRVWEGTANG